MKNKEEFLEKYNLSDFDIKELPQDASTRKYVRLSKDNINFILMDCPPSYISVEPFIKMTNFLLSNEFSAPEIFYQDSKNGFLLLEDFGTISFNKYLKENPDKEDELYFLAMDNLIKLSKIKVVDLDFPKHSKEILLEGLQ